MESKENEDKETFESTLASRETQISELKKKVNLISQIFYYLNFVFQCSVLESKENEDKENFESTLASRETQISELKEKVKYIKYFKAFQ